MRRRDFIWILGGSAVACTIGCTPKADTSGGSGAGGSGDGGGEEPDAGTGATSHDAGPDACVSPTVAMHDTYAQALYYDGTYGPLTGTITTAMVIASATITLDFWHGHGGILHRYTLDPSHFAALRSGQRVTLTTTEVEDHSHMLFVDPHDEAYRVPGAPDVEVPLGC